MHTVIDWRRPGNAVTVYRVRYTNIPCDQAKQRLKKDSPTMAVRPSEALQKISEQIKCPVCFEEFYEPKILPCLHVYCSRCLQAVAAKGTGETLACPMCRKETQIPKSGIQGLQTAIHIASLIEIHKAMTSTSADSSLIRCAMCSNAAVAVAFCHDCSKSICEFCCDVHKKETKYSYHQVLALDSEVSAQHSDEFCAEHSTHKLTLFCETCNLALCSKCAKDPAHKTHSVKHLTEVILQCKDAIAQHLDPVRIQLSYIDGANSKVETRSTYVAKQAEDLQSRIDSEITQMQMVLERRKKELKKKVDQIAHDKQHALKVQGEQLTLAHTQLSTYLKVVTQSLKKGSDRQVLMLRKAVEQRVEEITAEYSEIPLTPVEEANVHFMPDDEALEMCGNFGHVFSSSVCPGKCHARGGGLERAVMGEEASVTLTALTQDGEKCTEKLQHVRVELVSEVNHSKIKGKVEQQEGNTLLLSYLPPVNGSHGLHIKVNGEHILGSPFTLVVLPCLNFRGKFVKSFGGLSRPWGVAITSEGRIVVVDNRGWDAIHVFDLDGSEVRSFARSTVSIMPITPKEQCYEPRGIALDREGNIILVDGRDHRIQKFKPDGTFLGVKGIYGTEDPLQFNDPIGVGISESGEVYVCDRRNHRIQVLNSSLAYQRKFGRFGKGAEGLHYPWDVAFDSKGHVYVADCGNYCIKEFTPDGKFVRMIGKEGSGEGEFKALSSICIDRNDFIYAADKRKNCVAVFNHLGDFVMEFGTPGGGDGQFTEPLGVTVDRSGCVYVSDSYNGRVQIFQ